LFQFAYSLIEQQATIAIPTLCLYLFLTIASISICLKTHVTPVSQLRMQINSWWYLFPTISLALFFYPYGLTALCLIISALAARELASFYNGKRWVFYLLCAALQLFILYTQQYSSTLFALLPAALFGLLSYFVVTRSRSALAVFLFFLCAYGVSFILEFSHLFIKPTMIMAWVFYLFAITALNDVAQFISGSLFGKQKIAVRISPNKTWQGLVGGVISSMGLSIALGEYLQLANIAYLALLGLVLSLAGFCGDMLFSAAKRFFGIKDFSTLIPGHGGILDRVDSLVITTPLLYLVLHTTHIGFFK
jgi:phosphatidate cytidylyltransferase